MKLPSESKYSPLDEDNTMVEHFHKIRQQRHISNLHRARAKIREERRPLRDEVPTRDAPANWLNLGEKF